jgi:hypothetical protein
LHAKSLLLRAARESQRFIPQIDQSDEIHHSSNWKPIQMSSAIKQERGYGYNRNPLNFLVGGTGFEPVTSTV